MAWRPAAVVGTVVCPIYFSKFPPGILFLGESLCVSPPHYSYKSWIAFMEQLLEDLKSKGRLQFEEQNQNSDPEVDSIPLFSLSSGLLQPKLSAVPSTDVATGIQTGREPKKPFSSGLRSLANPHFSILFFPFFFFLNKSFLEKNRTTTYTGKRAQKFNWYRTAESHNYLNSSPQLVS